MPIKVRVECAGHAHEEQSTLVLHKRGLERLDRDEDMPSNPTLAEIGIEPG